MGFEKITFDENTLITPARLRHIETQYEEAEKKADETADEEAKYSEAEEYTDNLKQHSDKELKVEVLASPPAGEDARLYFDGTLYGWNGTEWIKLGEE